MLDWLADLLLNAGADIAGLFVSKDASSSVLFQMAMATLVVAAVVSMIVYWQSLVEYCRSRWRPRA